MQRDFAYVVVCTILATQLLSPAEGDDDNNTEKVDFDNYKGKADELFQFLQTLENDTVLYTIKRSYEGNIRRTTGRKTITCIKATVMNAKESSAGLCTIFKTVGENATAPFATTLKKTSAETIVGEPGSDRMTVHYVGNDEQCVIVQHMAIKPFPLAIRSCDMLRTSLVPTGLNCNIQFTRLCGSWTTSTSLGCYGVATPECNKASQSTLTANTEV